MNSRSIRFRIADFILRGELRTSIASARNYIELAEKCCNALEIGKEFRTPKRFLRRAIRNLVYLYEV